MTTTPLPPRPLEALRYLREVIPFRLNLEAKHQELYGNLKVIAECSERAAEDVVWCYAKWLEARADLEAENQRLREALLTIKHMKTFAIETTSSWCPLATEMVEIASAALESKP